MLTGWSTWMSAVPHHSSFQDLHVSTSFELLPTLQVLSMQFFRWDIMSCILQMGCLVYIFIEQRTHFVKPVFKSTCLASWQPGDYLRLFRLRSSLSSRSRPRYYSVWLAVCLSSFQYVSTQLSLLNWACSLVLFPRVHSRNFPPLLCFLDSWVQMLFSFRKTRLAFQMYIAFWISCFPTWVASFLFFLWIHFPFFSLLRYNCCTTLCKLQVH